MGDKARVGVYIDYSNVYKGARDAFILRAEPGYRGNVNPMSLAKHVALTSPDGCKPRDATHSLEIVKVFRGAPDPAKQKLDAAIEAARADQWSKWGCDVKRNTLDYGQGWPPVEKGIDVMLAVNLIADADKIDTAIIVSADKDFRPALFQLRDMRPEVDIEVAIWQAIPGGAAIGRIELQHDRPHEPEVPCHYLNRHDFQRWEDTNNYKERVEQRKPRPSAPANRGGFQSVFPRQPKR